MARGDGRPARFLAGEVVQKPWGHYRVLGQWSGRITVKVITVNPNSRLSLQKHINREEEWLCLSGRAQVQIDHRDLVLNVGDKVSIPREGVHRLASDIGAEILEVAYGEFDEDDIVRIEDDYGRSD
jgi:mannose-1-phosphate guanylyltransferase/mannose-6-phosphate isomerase